ncbi:acyltransferase family protein [Pseudomonas entomophila]|uniref:acyltransferase family protein n=1 Tax=Pseudomonas entomophila TaxID=312306 RepID=UPI002404D1DE|nr:acyltransferase family protein [Pseudomonas entomophila]MDF9617071.1 acyltransferase family protein [Pseudomonas entomophila]
MKGNKLAYRPDIDGLRALAVFLVLLFHFDLGVSGGFIGVDVFFVISGYLITEVIRNAIKNERFSFIDFYVRRLLRLHPALIVTVLLSLLFGYLIMDPAAFKALAESSKYSLFSASNFYFWLNQGYFDASAQTQPLLHTWSLGAEWQFYVAWPFVVWGALKLSDRFLFGLLVILTLLSLAASQVILDHDSSAAYFMMPFRVFELSIGALLVFIGHHRLGAKVESSLALIGMLAIVASALLLDPGSPFPGVRALVPCLGAAACIYAGRSSTAGILRTWPLVKLGLISYSVYLVHWPLAVFYKYYVFRPVSWPEKTGLLVASILLGYLMYRLVETVFMRKDLWVKPVGLITVTSSVAALAYLAHMVVIDNGMKDRVPADYLVFADDPANFHATHYGGTGFALDTTIGDAGGKLIAIVAGDSFALQYASGLDKHLKATGEKVLGVFQHGCLLSGEYTRLLNNVPRQDCRDAYRSAMAKLDNNNLPFVFAQSWEGYKGMIANARGERINTSNDAEYNRVIIDMLERLRADIGNRPLLIVGTQPYFSMENSAASCLLRPQFVYQGCQNALEYPVDLSYSHAFNNKLKEFSAAHPNTYYVDPADHLCKDGVCSAALKGEILYSDAVHLSIDGSLLASESIIQSLHKIQE